MAGITLHPDPLPQGGERNAQQYYYGQTTSYLSARIDCAHAKLRHPQTPAEATLWQHLRNRNLGYKFRRQHPIDRFIIDFYCAEAKLCIEIDGSSHFETEQEEYDKARTEFWKNWATKSFDLRIMM